MGDARAPWIPKAKTAREMNEEDEKKEAKLTKKEKKREQLKKYARLQTAEVYKARHAGKDDHWGNEEKVAMENMEKKANDFEWDGMNVVTGAVEKQPWDEKWDCPSLTYKQRLSNHLSNDVLDVIAPKQDWGTVERVEDVGADKMEDIAGALP